MENIIDGIKWTFGFWNFEGHGNHRAKVVVKDASDYNRVFINWRRHEKHPERINPYIEFEDGTEVKDYYINDNTNLYGDIVFKPECGEGIYYFYYYPYEKFQITEDFSKNHYTTIGFKFKGAPKLALKRNIPIAKCTEIQYRETKDHIGFNSFYPMEVTASKEEVEKILNYKEPFMTFFEDAGHPIKMKEFIPYRWLKKGPAKEASFNIRPGEIKAFQIGVYAHVCDLSNVKVETPKGITCINTEGIDYKGEYFTKTINVPKGQVGALWFLAETDKDINDDIKIITDKDTVIFKVSAKVKGSVCKDKGFDDMYSMSRLAWLNDQTGTEDIVPYPYKNVEFSKKGNAYVISILDRKIILNEFGLPKSITSRENELLADSILFDCGKCIKSDIKEKSHGNTFALFVSKWETEEFKGITSTRIEFDGCVDVSIQTASKKAQEKENVLLIPLRKEMSKYLMGYCKQGGYRTEDIDWKWNENQNSHKVWIGDADGGLYLDLRDTKDTFSMFYNSNFGNPPSWYNEGLGGSKVYEKGKKVFIKAYTGNRTFKKDQKIEFNFRLLITPFHKILPEHWSYIYTNSGIQKEGNLVHFHHAQYEYPYINYPFFHLDRLKKKFDEYSKEYKGINIYNTIRELSCHAPEIWAFESLGDEIFEPEEWLIGKLHEWFLTQFGGNNPWILEHLNFRPHPEYVSSLYDGEVDITIATNGLSRLANFFVKGFEYGLKKLPHDGLYVDSTNTDRRSFKRLVQIMEKERGFHRINLHASNLFNNTCIKSSPALTYMEILPYISSLFFGEISEYDLSEDYWFVECSGVPFGLTGEELLCTHELNMYKGLLYAMTTSRAYENYGAMVKMQNEILAGSELIGYWDKNCPVKSNNEKVFVSCYKKEDTLIIAVANFSDTQETFKLEFKDKGYKGLYMPKVEGFQGEGSFDIDSQFVVEHKKGFLFIVK